MSDTKENILLTALRLFAQNGYEAVSISMIADKLGMVKSVLYKHYKNKRDVFNSIVKRMEQMDFDRSKEYEMPEGTFSQMAEAYRKIAPEKIKEYSIAQFKYWTEDEFPASFRKMLTLEQYRSPEMASLYQQYLVSGPLEYMTDLFRDTALKKLDEQMNPQQLALDFYAPFYLLISVYDAAENKEEVTGWFEKHVEHFVKKFE